VRERFGAGNCHVFHAEVDCAGRLSGTFSGQSLWRIKSFKLICKLHQIPVTYTHPSNFDVHTSENQFKCSWKALVRSLMCRTRSSRSTELDTLSKTALKAFQFELRLFDFTSRKPSPTASIQLMPKTFLLPGRALSSPSPEEFNQEN
jgi:hypothetical protein